MPKDSPSSRKVAEYGQRPTVYAAPASSVAVSPRRLSGVVGSLAGLVVFLVGPPVGLWWVAGNPVDLLPSWGQVLRLFDQVDGRLNAQTLTAVAVWAGWVLWTLLVLLLVAQVVAVVARRRLPLPGLPAPLHRLVVGLAGSAAIAVTAAGRPDPTPPGQVRVPAQAAAPVQESIVVPGPATVHVGATSYSYTVRRDDTLSKIADVWLGDANRWPEICALNRHRHFPSVGGVLRDCDLIYPGWDLHLPADATPPPQARQRPAAPPDNPPPPAAGPDPGEDSDQDPDGVVEPPAAAPPANAPASPSPDAPSEAADPSSPEADPPGPVADDDGVRLADGSFVTWALAAAITAAAALVWLQRRRRHQPHATGTAGVRALPGPVPDLQRMVTAHPDLPVPADAGDRAAAVPAQQTPPPGGLAMTGPGAPGAVRALMVATLASGGPRRPDVRGEVIIDRATLTALLPAADVEASPRLRITASLDDSLTEIDVRLLHRSRVLHEHGLADLDTLRERVPAEEPFPPVLLISMPPPPGNDARLRAVLDLGATMDITGLFLGDGQPGATVTVAADGTTQPTAVFSGPVSVITETAAVAILTTLREAHTGQPPTSGQDEPHQPAIVPAAAPPNDPVETPVAEEAATPAGPDPVTRQPPKAQLRVLGPPRVENITLPGRPLRRKAAEMAVYLACHPDGADTRTIGEHLSPDVRLRQADQQVHTNASNLRHVLGRAAGPRPGGHLLKHGTTARYRLDPATVSVDLWHLRDLLTQARIAPTATRARLLREACDLYTAPLADGYDYDWIEPHREQARQWATEAHLLLAEDLLPHEPQTASDLLDKAIGQDPYHEQLYRTAMRARHALNDPDGIRTLLRALTRALADLDAEPEPATIALADQLATQLRQ
ncbi:BTAD domain-containing putative transcriptional regulator [Solwaraspora sp. WMMD1047]|uniref:BTAD domain-containing putative transcriptional regulator n=1 Tax=Solwaraspora sp. WMMD1047 TaxID=3016102 RepID=UPI002415D23B|nr:BTAD domain-containing putative transcriptional regulator [Solwaraspora sp. WMMD1047]MDG4834795.1 BTAD domain-containing putative transcriptional regulator [Solwaraspora sp. WMMD1047]